jgi:hypothetical protein
MFRLSLLFGLAACNTVTLSEHNTSPVPLITSPAKDEEVKEGELVALLGTVSDEDHTPGEMTIEWWVGGTRVCTQQPDATKGTVEGCAVAIPVDSPTIEMVAIDALGGSGTAVTEVVVPSLGPDAAIFSPLAGALFYSDVEILFDGTVSDEDDYLTDLQVTWTSSIQGELFEVGPPADLGRTTDNRELQQGDHTIRLEVKDPAGRLDWDEVNLTVNGPNQAPICEITSWPELSEHGETATFEATVADPDLVNHPELLTFTWTSDLDGTVSLGTLSDDPTYTTTGLTRGLHTLTLHAIDDGGLTCTDTITHRVVGPPILTVLKQPDPVVPSGEAVSIQVQVSDTEDDAKDLMVEFSIGKTSLLNSAPASNGKLTWEDLVELGEQTITVTATDTDGLTTWADVVFEVDDVPGAPTVDLVPSNPGTEDDLVASASGSEDGEGSTITYRYVWSRNGKVTAASTTETVDASVTARGDEWMVEVTPTDGVWDGPSAQASVTVGNTPPVLDAVAFDPAAPTTVDIIEAQPSTATDVDGDTITYAYRWFVDGEEVAGETSEQLSPGHFAVGDVVLVEVTPWDTTAGDPVETNVTIENSPPSLVFAEIDPDDPVTGDQLSVVTSGWDDADGDEEGYDYSWRDDQGTELGTSATLSSSFTDKGDLLHVVVTPTDGQDAGTSYTTSDVTIGNTAPEVTDVTLSPSVPEVGDDITATVGQSSDTDSDSVDFTYVWFVNYVEVSETSDTLSLALKGGDEITVEVTPTDGEDDGGTVSDTVTVGNSPPSQPGVDIAPTQPTTLDDLLCEVTTPSIDDDGTAVAYAMTWTRNGQTEIGVDSSHTGDQIPSTDTAAGEVWICTATPSDGASTGPSATSQVTIGNTAPDVGFAEIEPTEPLTADSLTVTTTGWADIDGTGEDNIVTWYDETDALLHTGDTFSSALTARDDQVYAIVTPTDGELEGTPYTTTTVTVGNTPPELASVSVTSTVHAATEVEATPGVASDDDVDDDVTFTYRWFVDTVEVQGETDDTLPTGHYVGGQDVEVEVTPTDGTDPGTPQTASVTVTNTVPTTPVVEVEPDAPNVDDDLLCEVTTPSVDDDGTGVTYTMTWTRNGQPETGADSSHTGDQIASVNTAAGEVWICTATPSDGDSTGVAATSQVTIGNTPPELAFAEIEPTEPLTANSLTVTTTGWADIDGTPEDNIVVWYDETDALLHTGDTYSSASTARGDQLYAVVTPTDGELEGTPYTTATVTVGNTPPELASVSVTNTVYAATEVEATPGVASDDDVDDDVTFTYRWFVDTVEVQGETDDTLPTGHYVGSQVVMVEVTPTDTIDPGTPKTASVTVTNTAPTTAVVDVQPDDPEVDDDLRCVVTTPATDDDGQSVAYTMTWTVNESPYADAVDDVHTGDRVVAADTKSAEVWECTATPSDGAASGPIAQASETVGSTPPQVDSAEITPDPAYTNTTLLVTAEGSDADGDDVNLTYAWYRSARTNETDPVFLGSGASLPGDDTEKHDLVYVEVTPTDTQETGSVYTSASIEIQNTPPTFASIVVAPSIPDAGQDLVASGTGFDDLDEDAQGYQATWTVNGGDLGGNGNALTLSSSLFNEGDTVALTLVAFDGEDVSAPRIWSATVGNAAPPAPEIEVLPANPLNATELTCSIVTPSVDPDGDNVTYEYQWFLEDLEATWTADISTLPATEPQPGESWHCEARATDGAKFSEWAEADPVDIGTPVVTQISAGGTVICLMDTAGGHYCYSGLPDSLVDYDPQITPDPGFPTADIRTGTNCIVQIATDGAAYAFGNWRTEKWGNPVTVQDQLDALFTGGFLATQAYPGAAYGQFGTEAVCLSNADDEVACIAGTGHPVVAQNPLASNDAVDSVSVSATNACVVMQDDGDLVCWGDDAWDLVDDAPAGSAWEKVDMSGSHGCVVGPSGVRCWGNNQNNQSPATLRSGRYIDVMAANGLSCAITQFNNVECWGAAAQLPPSGINDSRDWVSIDGQAAMYCLIDTEGEPYCWGNDGRGTVPMTPSEWPWDQP